MKEFEKLSDYAKRYNVTYTTAWNRFKANKITGAYLDNTGHVLIPITPTKPIDKTAILYSRVYSNAMKDNLSKQSDRLVNFATANGYTIAANITEIASGMNDNRSKLQKLLTRTDYTILIVEHKDRLTRFGFNYLKTLLAKLNIDIVVVNETAPDKQDLMQDLISIIYSFSARMYGLRRRKHKQEIINFLNK